jgi:hypothetical protein
MELRFVTSESAFDYFRATQAHISFGVVVMIAKLRIHSPAGELRATLGPSSSVTANSCGPAGAR